MTFPANENHAIDRDRGECTCGWYSNAEHYMVGTGVHVKMANDKARGLNNDLTSTLIRAYRAKEMPYDQDLKWMWYAARHFCGIGFGEVSVREAALAILNYFKNTDYMPTDNPFAIVSATLRVAS